jgi:hypothetical protein
MITLTTTMLIALLTGVFAAGIVIGAVLLPFPGRRQ